MKFSVCIVNSLILCFLYVFALLMRFSLLQNFNVIRFFLINFFSFCQDKTEKRLRLMFFYLSFQNLTKWFVSFFRELIRSIFNVLLTAFMHEINDFSCTRFVRQFAFEVCVRDLSKRYRFIIVIFSIRKTKINLFFISTYAFVLSNYANDIYFQKIYSLFLSKSAFFAIF